MIFFRLLLAMCSAYNRKFIKNQEYPICKTCQHYLPNNIFFPDDQIARCMKFGEKDVVTGKITYKYADLCRRYEACGQEGKYHEKRPDPFVTWL
jgi:hypothetical protein